MAAAAAVLVSTCLAMMTTEAKPPCHKHRLGGLQHHHHVHHSPSQGLAQVAMLKGTRDPRLSSWTTLPIVAEKMSLWKQAQVKAHDVCRADAELFCNYHDEDDAKPSKLNKIPTLATSKMSVSEHPPLRTKPRDPMLLPTMNGIPRPMPRGAAMVFQNHAKPVDDMKTVDDLMDEMMNEMVSMMNSKHHMSHIHVRSVPHHAMGIKPIHGAVRVTNIRQGTPERVSTFNSRSRVNDSDEFVDQLISSFFGVPIKDIEPTASPPADSVGSSKESQRRDEEEEDEIAFDSLVPVHSMVIPSDATSLEDISFEESKAVTFVNFCKSSCHWCQSLFPTFESLASSEDLTTDVKFVFVDCDKNMDLCRNELVFATPSLRLYHAEPKGSYEEYFGCRSEKALTQFLKDKLPEVESSITLTKAEEEPTDAVMADFVPPVISESKIVESNKHDWFYLDAAKEIRNAENALGAQEMEDEGDDAVAPVTARKSTNSDDRASSSDEESIEYEYDVRSAPALSTVPAVPVPAVPTSRYNDSSSKDDVTPLDWDAKEARRVSRFVEELEGMDDTEEEVPELRRRLSRRLSELKPVFISHDMIDRRGRVERSAILRKPHNFDFPWVSMSANLPNMGFGHAGLYEKCLVSHTLALSPSCSSAVRDLSVSLDQLQVAQERSWWMAILALYSVMIFIFVGLFLFKRVQRRKLVSFHKERTLRRDVLRVVHSNAELKAQVENALGRSLDKEAMTTDPVVSFKKKLGCMGMCCLTLPRMAIFIIYMCAVVAMPTLIWTVLVPTLLCMALYGYAVHCFCAAPKMEDEGESNDSRLGYPAVSNGQAVPLLDKSTNTEAITTADENGDVYEAIPVI